MSRRLLWFPLCCLLALTVLACASADSDPDPERDADDDADQNQIEPEPLVCDCCYNDTLGKGDLQSDLAGLEDYTDWSSSDVGFTWDDTGEMDGRYMLFINAREWCKPGITKSALLLSCRVLPDDLQTLPFTQRFSKNFISGSNSCKVSFTDNQANYRDSPDGEITIKTFDAGSGLSGSFEVSLTESTDPDHTLSFTNGAFEAIPTG